VKKILFAIVLISFGFSSELKIAKVDEYYKVSGKALALLIEPKVSVSANENKKNIIVNLNDEEYNIQIIDTKGVIDRYYEVNLIRDGKIKLTGWIWSKGVSSYKKISKSEAFYIKPIPKFKPSEDEIRSATKSQDVIIGKWLDDDQYIGGIYIITKTAEGISIKITYKDGSVVQKSATISKCSDGKKVNYENDFGEYYIIYDTGNLGLCDDMGFIESLKPLK